MKDIRESSSKSLKKDKAPMDFFQEDIPVDQSQDDSNIDQDEDCILGLSTVTVAKKIKELIKKDEIFLSADLFYAGIQPAINVPVTIADMEGAGLEMLKRQYKNYVELKYHVDQLKEAVIEEAQWSDFDNDLSKH
ncbi:hypothetical protein Tco_1486570 [Tanacetum coccineum]